MQELFSKANGTRPGIRYIWNILKIFGCWRVAQFFFSPSQGCTDEALHVLQRKTSYRHLVAAPCQILKTETNSAQDRSAGLKTSNHENPSNDFVHGTLTLYHNIVHKTTCDIPAQFVCKNSQFRALCYPFRHQLRLSFGKDSSLVNMVNIQEHSDAHARSLQTKIKSEQKLNSLTMFGPCFCSPER